MGVLQVPVIGQKLRSCRWFLIQGEKPKPAPSNEAMQRWTNSSNFTQGLKGRPFRTLPRMYRSTQAHLFRPAVTYMATWILTFASACFSCLFVAWSLGSRAWNRIPMAAAMKRAQLTPNKGNYTEKLDKVRYCYKRARNSTVFPNSTRDTHMTPLCIWPMAETTTARQSAPPNTQAPVMCFP